MFHSLRARSAALCVTLALLALAFFSLGRGGAQAGDHATAPGRLSQTNQVANTPISERYHISAVASHGGLTLFAVKDRQAPARIEGDFTTLAEAFDAGTITITELDASGSVPELMVHNSGKKPVLLTAGDVVAGGKQDRVVIADVVVAPSDAPVAVAVNCVERGRWDASGGGLGFGYAGKGEAALKQVLQSEEDQSATWREVAKLNADKSRAVDAADLAPSTGTYRASMTSGAVAKRTDGYVQVLAPAMVGEGVVGVVAAMGTDIVTAELFGHPALFDKNREDIVRALALDAVSRNLDASTTAPDAKVAAGFLADALLTKAAEVEAAGTTQRIKRKGKAADAYELRDEDGDVIHLNVYAN